MRNKKKIAMLLLSSMILTGSLSSAVELSDIGSHWAEGSIKKLVSEGVINGYSDGTFLPDNPISREEASKLVDVYFGKLIKSKGKALTFSDVNSEMWSEKHIKRLVDAGIINGYSDGGFRPGNNISREEISKMICAALENTEKYKDNGKSVPLSDINNTWAKEYIEKLVAMGVIKGYDQGDFRPANNITRAEVAKILDNINIPVAERKDATTPGELKVSVKMLPQAYGVHLNDTAISKGNLESKILEGVTAVDQNGNGITNIKINAEDLEKFDKSTTGTYTMRVEFRNDNGDVDEKKVDVIVNDFKLGTWLGNVSIEGTNNTNLADVAIPREVNGTKVVVIMNNAFQMNQNIKKMYISRDCALAKTIFASSKIEEVVFEEGYRADAVINTESFKGAKNLRSINIPESITEIKSHAFEGCESLKDISIPKNVKVIGEFAFKNSGVEKVNFATDSNLEFIYKEAFNGSAIKRISIPKSVKYVASKCFENSSLGFMEFEKGSKLGALGEGVFQNCKLTQTQYVPTTVKKIYFLNGTELNVTQDSAGEDLVMKHCFDEDEVNVVFKDL